MGKTGSLAALENKTLIFESPSLEDQTVPFQGAIAELLKAATNNDYDTKMKEAWAKLGFDEFL